ncbi:MAG: GTP pyrophosphokinase family protein [Firmicutes bacterium]|nr:GTP pyrophosphokinase family protein [Bacillota bacterium]
MKINDNYDLSSLMVNYSAALKILKTELEILSDEFEYSHKYNPVEHIKCRIKSYESIMDKLEKKGLDKTIDNIIEYVNDVVGVRVVCSFLPDVYEIVNIIQKSKNIKVLYEKDYIKDPKDSGYSSYHLIVSVPVNLSIGTIYVKAEIQIRTVAMDFWASLDHKISYKFPEPNALPVEVIEELKNSSDVIKQLDKKMAHLVGIVNDLDIDKD